jgi:hypothetical protein
MQSRKTSVYMRALLVQVSLITTMVILPASHVGRAEAPVELPTFAEASQTMDQDTLDQVRAQKIDAYFAKWNLPLAGHGMDFVKASNESDIPWNMLAAIAMIETTGGKFACKNPNAAFNAYGWGSCRDGFGFESWEDGINKISAHLGGHSESTKRYYHGMTTRQRLEAYNPPSIVPDYADKVMRVMDKIENQMI